MIALERLRKEFDKVWKEAVKGSADAAAQVDSYVAANRELVGLINSQTAAWNAQRSAIREVEAAERARERTAFELLSRRPATGPGPGYNPSSHAVAAAHLNRMIEGADSRGEQEAIERIKEKAAWQLVEIRNANDIAEQERLANLESGKGLILLQRRKELADQADSTERIKEKLAWNAIEIRSQEELAEAKRVANIEDGRGINVIEQNIAKKEAAKAATDSYIASVNAAKAADENWNVKQAQLHIQFRTLTDQIEVHKAKIKELTTAEKVNADAVEFEARALSMKQGQLIQVERQMANSNAAMRQNRLVTQSAAYAIQDFIQGLSVGSFSMAVRGAANNVETLAASFAIGASNATFMALALAPTAILLGVTMYEAWSKVDDSQKKAADSAKEYDNAIKRIKESTQDLFTTERQRADLKAKEDYREARGIAYKEQAAAHDPKLIGGHVLTDKQLQEWVKSDSAELDNMAANPRAFDPAYQAHIRKRRDANKKVLDRRLAAQARVAAIEDAENERKRRVRIEEAVNLAGGKQNIVENAAKAIKGGMNRDLVIGQIRDAVGQDADGLVGDIDAKVAVDRIKDLKDAPLRRQKDILEQKRRDLKALEQRKAGAFAIQQAKAGVLEAENAVAGLEKALNAPGGAFMQMLVELRAIRDAVQGVNGPPKNDFIRNNANVINPFQWIPGIGR